MSAYAFHDKQHRLFLRLIKREGQITEKTMRRMRLWNIRYHVISSLRQEGFQIWMQYDVHGRDRTYLLGGCPFWYTEKGAAA